LNGSRDTSETIIGDRLKKALAWYAISDVQISLSKVHEQKNYNRTRCTISKQNELARGANFQASIGNISFSRGDVERTAPNVIS
jgi:hypothetical protein